MKRYTFGLLLCLGFLKGSGQAPEIGGLVQTDDHQPLFGATVAQLGTDSTLLGGTITDIKGHFKMVKEEGSKMLMISSLGYQDSILNLGGQPHAELVITLKNEAMMLDEISVVGKKPLLEQRPDRLVMNLSASPSTAGTSALQVLSRLPGVFVDQQNGQISITGKDGVLIMINDRISRAPVQMLLNQLEAMKADQLEKIELIHQPPAKYDASGSGGIIHLVLKDDNRFGFNGSASLSAGYGQLGKLGASVLTNFRADQINAYGEYDFTFDENHNLDITHQRAYEYQGDHYDYYNLFTSQYHQKKLHNGRLGLDYQINDQLTFGLLAGLGDYSQSVNGSSRSTHWINNHMTNELRFSLRPQIFNRYHFVNANLLSSSGSRTINLDVDYAKYELSSPGDFHLISSNVQNVPTDFRVTRNTPLELWTVKGDLTQKTEGGHRWEFGGKVSLSTLDNRALIEQKEMGIWTTNDFFSSEEYIDENIYAGYISFVPKLGTRTSLETGLRYEYYDYHVNTENNTYDFRQTRSSLFPVLRFNYKMDSLNSLQIAYNRRVQRPAYNQLASYFVFVDPSLVGNGNPLLRPSFIHSVKLAYMHRSMYFALEGTRSNNFITYRNTVDKPRHLQTSTQHNFNRFDIASLTISIPIHLASWWDFHLTAVGQYRETYDDNLRDIPFTHHKTNLILQSSQAIRFTKSYSMDIQLNSYRDALDGDQVKFDILNLSIGLQKKFKSGSTLSLALNDLLNSAARIPWEYHQPEIAIRTFGLTQVSERRFMLTYGFSFGNKEVEKHRERRTASEEERQRVENQ